MKKIGLLYLNETNLGDIVIYDTTKYLTKEICKANNIENEIISLDIGLNTPKSYILNDEEQKTKENNLKFIKKCKKFAKKLKLIEKLFSLVFCSSSFKM